MNFKVGDVVLVFQDTKSSIPRYVIGNYGKIVRESDDGRWIVDTGPHLGGEWYIDSKDMTYPTPLHKLL